jgi:transcriptional antiterminator NusG
MSVQEPQDQFERESVEAEVEESQDSLDETSLTDSDTSSSDSESIDVPAPTGEADAASEDSTSVEEEESDELDVPKIESMPVSSSDALPAPEPTEGPAWYVIHCYSGYENKVRHNLEQRIETMGMKDKIFDVVIPTQEEIEVKDGKRRTVERHIFPGYVLVNMALTEESWYVVRNTPGVTGFVGMGNNPTPLRPEEVAQIVKRMEAEAPTVKVTFKVGERVRIIDGPFNDFRGVVSEIDMERTKVRVMVSFFGRETPVELDFLQVEKA